jgi:very-short-patch-repair endonuclease
MNAKYVLKNHLLHLKNPNIYTTKQSIRGQYLKMQIKNIGLIVINATIVLKWWCPEYILATDGVHTVHTTNYVKMLNVNHVLKTHLIHMKNRNIYTTKHKYWFDCDKCEHKFETSLLNINQQNSFCPYCSKHCVTLCKDKKCNQCFEKSFASHEFSNFWDLEKNGGIKPRDIFKYCDKKYWFNCHKCSHKLHIMIKSITRNNHGCSYCSHQKLCEMTDCQRCFNNSFASVERSKHLHYKTINARTLFKSTNKRFKFDCNLCNGVFETQLADITKGVWCPFCLNKTEQMLFDKLVLYYPLLKRQYKRDWCKKINYLPFDFVIEYLKIIIELDGKQHFEQIGNWPSPEKTQENDLYKMKCANENGFSVIRILQKDVYYNKYDWLDELMKNIEILKTETVINIYMSNGNESDCFNSK